MIITKTPFRMSFFGGGTDFPEFYEQYGGKVISTTIDKYCYVNVRHLPRFFKYTNQIVYSKIENASKLEEIKHPAVREAMRMLDMHELRLEYDADLPARSGLGTSSSFAVGMLQAFHALKGHYADKERLAKEAIYLERVLCKEAGGIQDQIAAAYGNLNKISFSENGFIVTPVIISKERKKLLNDNLMLFFTGFSRFSSDIQIATKQALSNKTTQMKEMLSIADEAEKILINKNGNLREIGKLLDDTWKLKRGISNKISTDSIDCLYKTAIEAGAVGGKLLGAGGGGFLLLYVENPNKKKVLEALNGLLYVPFKFEESGAQVLYFAPEDYTNN